MEPISDPKKKPILALEVAEYSTINKGHILWLFGHPIAIREFFQATIFFVICVLAFNYGYAGNGQVVAVASQLCTEGVYDQSTHLWIKCYPNQQGNSVIWSCVNNSQPFSEVFPIDYNHTLNMRGN
jgi:hypothetical protein